MADTYTTEAIACGLSDVAGWLENEGGRDSHARIIRLGVERLRELGAAQPVIVGWHSIARLAADGEVRFDESPVILIAASDLYGNDIAALQAPAAPSHPGVADRVGLPHPQAPNTLSEVEDLRARATAAEDKLRDREAEIERLKAILVTGRAFVAAEAAEADADAHAEKALQALCMPEANIDWLLCERRSAADAAMRALVVRQSVEAELKNAIRAALASSEHPASSEEASR